MHYMLHTVDIKGGAQGTKECIECWAGEGKRCDARANGSFARCHSDSHCSTVNEDPVPTQYRLRPRNRLLPEIPFSAVTLYIALWTIHCYKVYSIIWYNL
jgi:hypothetical protein